MESKRHSFLTNPRKTANFLSTFLFAWTIPIFKKGYKKALGYEDVYEPLDNDRSTKLGNRLDRYVNVPQKCLFEIAQIHYFEHIRFRNWQFECKTAERPSLLRAVLKTFWFSFLVMAIQAFFYLCVARLTIPCLLKQLLTSYR